MHFASNVTNRAFYATWCFRGRRNAIAYQRCVFAKFAWYLKIEVLKRESGPGRIANSTKTRGTLPKPANVRKTVSYSILTVRVADKNMHFRSFLCEVGVLVNEDSDLGEQAFQQKPVVQETLL